MCNVSTYPPEVEGGILVQALVGVRECPESSLSTCSRLQLLLKKLREQDTDFPRFQ